MNDPTTTQNANPSEIFNKEREIDFIKKEEPDTPASTITSLPFVIPHDIFVPSKRDPLDRKYRTFDNSKKELIINDLKKCLGEINKWEGAYNEITNPQLIKLIENTKLEDYNRELKRLLKEHVEISNPTIKVLTQWRKKIKSWLKNFGKPETRGGLLINAKNLDFFRTRIIDLLKCMRVRSFKVLRENLIKIFQEFYASEGKNKNNDINDGKICSKHWWFDFIKKNKDIKKLWESLPREKSPSLKKAMAENGEKGAKVSSLKPAKADFTMPDLASLTMPASALRITPFMGSAALYQSLAMTTGSFMSKPNIFVPMTLLPIPESKVGNGDKAKLEDPEQIVKKLKVETAGEDDRKMKIENTDDDKKTKLEGSDIAVKKENVKLEAHTDVTDANPQFIQVKTEVHAN